jgi:hypothetical protein
VNPRYPGSTATDTMVDRKARRSSQRSGHAPCAVIVYENSPAQEIAYRFWHRIEQQHPAGEKFDVSWWTFELLGDPTEAGRAARKAARADLIVFASGLEGELPDGLKAWIESWLAKRQEREGAIVGLVRSTAVPCAIPGMKEIYLRQIAHRAGMDYLMDLPPGGSLAMPNSPDSFYDRAVRVTSVLDGILRARFPSSPPP